MSRKCFKHNAGELLKQFEKQKIRPGKEEGAAYIKRSLELIEEGWKGSIIFDEAGGIAAAAAYEVFKGKLRVETLGSVGKLSNGVTPGMSLLYDIMKQASGIGNGDIILYATPGSVDFYSKYHFVSDGPDGRRLKAEKAAYQKYMDWFQAKTGGKK